MQIELKIPKSNTNNKVMLSGIITVSEEISGQVDLVIEANKCSLDMSNCEKAPAVNIKDMCGKFKSPFYATAFASIQPPLACPIKPGNYTMRECAIELSMIALLPLDGFIYVTSMKMVASENGGKKKRLIFCLNAETKIFKIRVK